MTQSEVREREYEYAKRTVFVTAAVNLSLVTFAAVIFVLSPSCVEIPDAPPLEVESDFSIFADLSDSTEIPEDRITNTNFECGNQKIKPSTRKWGKIIGGNVATPHSWPWIISLRKLKTKYTYSHYCGGSIASPRHVITAAHCFKYPISEERGYEVLPGLQSVRKPAYLKFRAIKAVKVRIHPKHDKRTTNFDSALVTLSEDLTFSDKIMPVCLPKLAAVKPPGTRCWAYGWGKTQDPTTEKIKDLRQVELPLVDFNTCKSKLTMLQSLHRSNVVCAGGESGLDTCQGDSGGPLTCLENGVWVLYGITSFGRGCGQNLPAVYAATSYHLSWLCCFMKGIPGCRGVTCDKSGNPPPLTGPLPFVPSSFSPPPLWSSPPPIHTLPPNPSLGSPHPGITLLPTTSHTPPVWSKPTTTTRPKPVWSSTPYTTTSRPPWIWSPQPIKTTRRPGPVPPAPVPSIWRPSGSSGPSPSFPSPSPAGNPHGQSSVWGPSSGSSPAGSSISEGSQPGSSALPLVWLRCHVHSWTFVICLIIFVMRLTYSLDLSFSYSVPFREFLLCHIVVFLPDLLKN